MTTINLRDYYPSAYKTDCFMDVRDDIAGAMAGAEREDHAYYERRRYHKAYYSLDAGDGIENNAVYRAPSAEQLFMEMFLWEQLYTAFTALPEKQRKRIYQHYFLDMSKAGIARAEGLSESAVKDAIYRGLKNMEQFFKKL